jgi:phospholipid/cholesterol/gamma-HCH transport system permease protein
MIMVSTAIPTSLPSSSPEAASVPAPPAGHARGVKGLIDDFGELVIFSGQALRALPGSLRYSSEIMRINALITRRTTVLLFIMCGFLGASASNFGFFLLRSLGASDFVGIVPAILTPRQLGPQMFGYVFAGSVCCGIAAEIGSAKVQQEVDAYESEGIEPMEYLVGTRVLASILYVPLAAMAAVTGMLFGSYMIIVVVLHGNTTHQFLSEFFSVIPPRSLVFCTITIALVTLQCTLVATFYGMRAGGGPDAVGKAVARSLAVNLVLIHVVISLMALIFYAGGLGLPIGN